MAGAVVWRSESFICRSFRQRSKNTSEKNPVSLKGPLDRDSRIGDNPLTEYGRPG